MIIGTERWLTGYKYGRLVNATHLDLIVNVSSEEWSWT